MGFRHAPSDADRDRGKSLLPGQPGTPGGAAADHRRAPTAPAPHLLSTRPSLAHDGTQSLLRFSEQSGKDRAIPVRHDLERFLWADARNPPAPAHPT